MTAIETASATELERRAERFRRDRPRIPLTGRIAVLVDDGIATGATARAACQVARAHGAARVVLAVPVGPADIVAAVAPGAPTRWCAWRRRRSSSRSGRLPHFTQTSDDEVIALLPVDARPRRVRLTRRSAGRDDPPLRDEEVEVPAGAVRLAGHLTIPRAPPGVVVFAHGSGSSRHSPRNRYVAARAARGRAGTLLFDLLTPEEERATAPTSSTSGCWPAGSAATAWLRGQPDARALPLGYFGASTGRRGGLVAAAEPRGGVARRRLARRPARPGRRRTWRRCARRRCSSSAATTTSVLELNRRPRRVHCEHRLDDRARRDAPVRGARHAGGCSAPRRDWFIAHLARAPHSIA